VAEDTAEGDAPEVAQVLNTSVGALQHAAQAVDHLLVVSLKQNSNDRNASSIFSSRGLSADLEPKAAATNRMHQAW
jgi:hypothetical protein